MNEKNTNQKCGQLEQLPITDIVPSGDNPRTINEKSEAFVELTESIRAQGVIVPVHVRTHPEQKKRFELLAGERRLRASIKAGKSLIPAINHGEINDEQAFEITFTENYQREDLTPIEQGKAAEILLSKYKGDTPAVASKMGKSTRWVLQRIAIKNNLSDLWKQTIAEKSFLSHLPASHFGLIASLPANIQDEILDEACEWEYEGVPTTTDLEKQIAAKLMVLRRAPWDVDDAKLINGIEACSKCPKRSSHQPGLFDDTMDEEAVKKNDRCLDNRCWNKKMEGHIKIRLKELTAKHNNLVCAVMPDQKIDYDDRSFLSEKYGNIASQWKASKEDAKDAIPALIVYGKNAGELRWIKMSGGSVTDSRGIERKTGADGRSKPKSLKERRDMLKRKRWFQVLRELVKMVEKREFESFNLKQNRIAVIALAGIMGTWGKHDYLYKDTKGDWDEYQNIFDLAIKEPEKAMVQVITKLWREVRPVLTSRITYNQAITQTPNEYIKEAKYVANLLNIDIDALFKAAKHDYPEPKSWKKLNADGTPKKAKKAKKKAAKKSAKIKQKKGK